MAYPEELLSRGEEIVKETRQHWIALQNEILLTLALVAVWVIFIPTLDFFADEWIWWGAFAAWIVLVFKGVTDYFTTQLVLTNKKVVYRRGLISKVGYEIPVERIQDVGFRQRPLQRMVNAGDLLVDSATDAKTVIEDVAGPIEFKNQLNDIRDARIDERFQARSTGEAQATAPSPGSPAESAKSKAEALDILAKLHSEGKLTDEEFASEKAKLLGS
jgi:uncharacterized membrane protein YdbT with pleckstrin-like domain